MDCVDAGISLEVKSPPGRGKSEFFEELIKKLSLRDGFQWGYAPMFLATQTPPDLIGYQFKGERPWGKNGAPIAVTEPTLPLWMMTHDGKPLWAFKRGLVVLEEYGQGESDVKRASAQLLLKGEIGPWRVPNFGQDGWGVVACSNRFGIDRSGVTKDFDFVINRRMEVHLRDDAPTWETWANTHEVDPIIISFAMQYPHLVWNKDVPEKQGPWCTPRSLVMADKFLRTRARRSGGTIPDDPTTMISVAGLIGQGTMATLFTHIKLERELPSLLAVTTNPEGTPVPNKADLRMLLVYSFGHKVNKDNIKPLLTYITRMGKEFTMAFLRTAIIRDSSLLMTPTISQWSKQNAQLIVQISQAIK
jgi:hypothetical protein